MDDRIVSGHTRARIEMAPKCRGAAVADGPKSFELLKTETGSVPVQKAIALRVEDIGHLHGGFGHNLFLRLKRRSLSATGERLSFSNGLITACRCCCERCK